MATTLYLLYPQHPLWKRKSGWSATINKVPFEHSPFGWPPEIMKGLFCALIKSDSVMSAIGGWPSSSPPLTTQAAGTVHRVSSIPVTRLSLTLSFSVSLSLLPCPNCIPVPWSLAGVSSLSNTHMQPPPHTPLHTHKL